MRTIWQVIPFIRLLFEVMKEWAPTVRGLREEKHAVFFSKANMKFRGF